MYPHQNYQSSHYKEDPRLLKLRQDNSHLQKALKQLNECYQQKTFLLQEQLKQSKQRQQTLLQWKSNYIDKQLFNNAKYEQQLEKMVTMMQEMARNYEQQNEGNHNLMQEKDEQITRLKDENMLLRQERDSQEEKVQLLAQKYIGEIERLNNELKQLKEEIIEENDNDEEIQFSVQHGGQDESPANVQRDQGSIFQEEYNQEHGELMTVEQQNILKDISNNDSNQNITTCLTDQKSSAIEFSGQLRGKLVV